MSMKTNHTEGSPIMNFKKTIFCASLSIAGLAALVFSFSCAHIEPAVASEREEISNKVALYDDTSFAGETEIGAEDLLVKATASTKTTMGESFTFSFSTGGTGYQDSTKTFTIAPTDSSFSTYYDEFVELTTEQKEEIQAQYDEGEYETQAFGGQVYSLNYTSSDYANLVVPRTLSRGIFFRFDINEIATEALSEETVASGITSVTIPNTISDLYEDSFPETLPSGFVFNVEFEESEVPETWATGWNHGATVNYGYDYSSLTTEKQQNAKIAGSTVEYGDKTTNFIIGYYPSDATQYPLVMSYQLVDSDETLYYEFEKSTSSSKGSAYDAVGYILYGYSNSLFADIALDLSDGQEIDFSTVVIHNIFPAVKDATTSKYVPDTTSPYYSCPLQSYSKTLDVTDLIDYRFEGISTFSGYTAIDLLIDQTGDETYSALKSSFFKQYEDNIEKGSMYIRYRLTSLTACYFEATYEQGGTDVVQEIPISTPVNQHILRSKNNNFVSFLFKNSDIGSGFNANSVRQLSFVSFYITLDLFDNSTGIVARSAFNARFGFLMVMPYSDSTSVFDINTMLIILSCAYVGVYLVGAVALFLYKKKRFKNDEFRRLKPKSFILKSVLGLFGSLIVILCITFIVIRATAFNNAIVVYNPVDAYIIITVVASVLIIGYFLKYVVAVSKANKERKKAIKLKLNEDVAEDGTN